MDQPLCTTLPVLSKEPVVRGRRIHSIVSLVGVRSPGKAESRWTLPALLEEAGNGPK